MPFPLGVRLSTWIAIAAFLLLTGRRRDAAALRACAAWLAGFEVAYQLTSLGFRHPLPEWRWGPFVLIGLGLAVVISTAALGARPAPGLMAVVALVWVIWLTTGFHVNPHGPTGFDPTGEVLNDLAKTVWAAAYMWPLLGFRPHVSSELLQARGRIR